MPVKTIRRALDKFSEYQDNTYVLPCSKVAGHFKWLVRHTVPSKIESKKKERKKGGRKGRKIGRKKEGKKERRKVKSTKQKEDKTLGRAQDPRTNGAWLSNFLTERSMKCLS